MGSARKKDESRAEYLARISDSNRRLYAKPEFRAKALQRASLAYRTDPAKFKAKAKLWLQENPERDIEGRARRHREDPTRRMYTSAKHRARKMGLEFTITRDDLVIPELCPVLGIPIFSGTKRAYDNSPSIDRIDPQRGYVKGNVRVISLRANRLKNDGTAEEHHLIAQWMEAVALASELAREEIDLT